MDNSFPTISYAECVKTNSNGTEYVDLHTAPMSWYEQVESYQNSIVSRANSMSTILSDDAAANCPQHLTTTSHRYSISHSMDSGQLSDLSSDNEQCSKPSTKCTAADDNAASTNTTSTTNHIKTSPIQQRDSVHHIPFERRESTDSSRTSSSACCADPHCTRDHYQMSQMCHDRWISMETTAVKVEPKFEHDEGTLARRQKQIDYGKSTLGYELYTAQVQREKRTKDHPQTPDKTRKYSRRAFDGLIRIWRKQLHKFDPNEPHEPTNSNDKTSRN